MSVDSTALERSALERKDRDELVTIAQALGGKPAARATNVSQNGIGQIGPGQIQQLTPPCEEHVPLRFCEQLYV